MADHPHAQGRSRSRPLSPFLTIYRWPITMATSITHRATGTALAAGLAIIAWWLVAVASGPDSYEPFVTVVSSPLGQIVLFGFVWSLVFHFLNGIRHLAWDVGFGFKLSAANRSGILVISLSLLISIGVFVFAHMQPTGVMP